MTTTKIPAALSVFIMPEDLNNLPPPDNGPYYVVGRNKHYIHRNFHFGRYLGEISEFKSVPPFEFDAMLWKSLEPKIPIELVGKAWHFFRSVWNQHKSEAMVDITWSAEKGYRLFVPKQETSHSSVEARRVPEHYENSSMTVGTIHSHCDFSAFHSGTDETDAKDHDGIHLTIGHVDKNPPEVAAMIMVGGDQFEIKDLNEFFTDNKVPFIEHPEWWNKQIVKSLPPIKKPQANNNTKIITSGWGTAPAPLNLKNKRSEKDKTNNDTFNQIILPKEWEKRTDLTLEELAYTGKKLTAAQTRRLEDALDLMGEMDMIMASVGLQIVYNVIPGSPINHRKLMEEAARKQAEDLYYSDAFPWRQEHGHLR